MSEYWISQPRKFCEFCQCWITDNKPSVQFHEKGKRHQENVKKKITMLRKKGVKDAEMKQEFDDSFKAMEEAAMKALKEDLAKDPSLAAQYGVTIKEKPVQGPEPMPEGYEKSQEDEKEATVGEWCEALSPEGYTYYWNPVTQETSWEKPASYRGASSDDPAGGSSLSEDKQTANGSHSEPASSSATTTSSSRGEWYAEQTPEGYTYYWNPVTGERTWVKPKEYIEKNEKTVEATESTALAESTGNIPLPVSTDTTDSIPLPEPTESIPLPQSTDDIPLPQSTDDIPLPQSTDDIPLPESTDNIPLPKSMEKIPLPLCTEDIPLPDSASKIKEKKEPTEDDQVASDKNDDKTMETPREKAVQKRPMKRGPYGQWEQIQEEEEPAVDLQLPETAQTENVQTIVISEPKIKFREKKVSTLSFPWETKTGFKKRKFNSGTQKNMRQRGADN